MISCARPSTAHFYHSLLHGVCALVRVYVHRVNTQYLTVYYILSEQFIGFLLDLFFRLIVPYPLRLSRGQKNSCSTGAVRWGRGEGGGGTLLSKNNTP